MAKSIGKKIASQVKDTSGDLVNKASNAINTVKEIRPEDALMASLKLPGTRIDREQFLRKELKPYYPSDQVDLAIEKNPAYAGIPRESVTKIAKEVISYETNKVSALSFAAGLPGGLVMFGTVPADIAQYFAFMVRIMQELAYLYGFDEFEFHEDQVNAKVMNEMLIFLGVMFGVDAANAGVKIIADTAAAKVSKSLAQKALTKGTVYPIVKKVLQTLGFRITKDVFAKGVSKIVPIVGGVTSGGLSFVSFRTCCNRLQKSFKTLNISDPEFYRHDE